MASPLLQAALQGAPTNRRVVAVLTGLLPGGSRQASSASGDGSWQRAPLDASHASFSKLFSMPPVAGNKPLSPRRSSSSLGLLRTTSARVAPSGPLPGSSQGGSTLPSVPSSMPTTHRTFPSGPYTTDPSNGRWLQLTPSMSGTDGPRPLEGLALLRRRVSTPIAW
jgi:hypothetical protein